MTSNAPSVERSRHAEAIEPPRVDLSAFRQGWRVRTRLDGLLLDRLIDAATWQAAVDYRDAWLTAWGGQGGQQASGRTSGGVDVHARQIALLATLADVEAVNRQLGADVVMLCARCVILDQSWAETGRQTKRDAETVKTWTANALRTLAVAWADRRGRLRRGGFGRTRTEGA